MTRRYEIRHRTAYSYQDSIDLSYNQLRLTPLSRPGQRVVSHSITITPKPLARRNHTDGFGNQVTYFEIGQRHQDMVVTSESLVETEATHAPTSSGPESGWETVRDHLTRSLAPRLIEGQLFTLPTPIAECSPALRDYAQPSFPSGRPLREAALDLMGRIHREFKFDPAATTVATPLAEVLKGRKGVCQDFAHLAIGCLRSLGLAARYVSGYLETVPPPGKERLVGADASHAWLSVLDPETGWMDLDPTNNLQPAGQHITVAVGRDYADVTPVKGLTVGSGDHQMEVTVDVIPQLR